MEKKFLRLNDEYKNIKLLSYNNKLIIIDLEARVTNKDYFLNLKNGRMYFDANLIKSYPGWKKIIFGVKELEFGDEVPLIEKGAEKDFNMSTSSLYDLKVEVTFEDEKPIRAELIY